jgi:DNA-binding MarR family transcriptional regulator
METKPFDLIEPQYCVNAKVRRIHRLLNEPYQNLIKPYGLKGSMLSILFMIGKMHTNQKMIAQQLVLDESTISRDLKKLEAMELIERKRGEDARNITLDITPKGFQLLNEVAPKWAELHEKVSKAIGEVQLSSLNSLMKTLEKIEL